MSKIEHDKILKNINDFDMHNNNLSEWAKGEKPLKFIRENEKVKQIAIYAVTKSIFIHSLVVPNKKLNPIDHNDLLSWSCNAYSNHSSYVYSGKKVWIERNSQNRGAKTLDSAVQLLYIRDFEGFSNEERNYFELNQEYSHLNDIHFRAERSSYCKFDDNGDFADIVSITKNSSSEAGSLVSFNWHELERYLSFSNSSLVRLFDFTMFQPNNFMGWSQNAEQVLINDELSYRQKIDANAGYIRGFQIIKPRSKKSKILKAYRGGDFDDNPNKFVEFLALDTRTNMIKNISTNPKHTINYFQARDNNLPFELAPAFFRAEVLSKYKADTEKYTIRDRSIDCRASWHLKGYDVNKAGQVHAYICDLRNLPYNEQLYWRAFNEEPKDNISERAYINDIMGEFSTIIEPLSEVKSILENWSNNPKIEFWKLRAPDLLQIVNIPLTSSKKEWGDAFTNLAKLINEGFDLKTIRSKLTSLEITHDKDLRSIKLLELLNDKAGNKDQFHMLKEIQKIRSEVAAHAGKEKANIITHEVLLKHNDFSSHFKYVCNNTIKELNQIQKLFS